MKVDIYRSLDNKDRQFVVRSETDTSVLPEEVETTEWKSIDIEKGDNRIGLSGTNAIQDIEESGYHVTYARLLIGEIF